MKSPGTRTAGLRDGQRAHLYGFPRPTPDHDPAVATALPAREVSRSTTGVTTVGRRSARTGSNSTSSRTKRMLKKFFTLPLEGGTATLEQLLFPLVVHDAQHELAHRARVRPPGTTAIITWVR